MFVGKCNILAVATIVLCEDSAIYIFEVVTLTFNVTVETFSLGTMSLLIMTTFEFYKLLLGLFGANHLLYLLDVFSCHQ